MQQKQSEPALQLQPRNRYILTGAEIILAGYDSPTLNDSRFPDLIIGAKVGTLWN
jgi:hypothetical protein